MKIFRRFFMLPTIILFCCVIAFVSGLMVNCDKDQAYKEQKNLCEEETKYSETLLENCKWFMVGYIDSYRPGRHLFNGSTLQRRTSLAAHPYLPIGTLLLIKNLNRNVYSVVPVLDRKANIGDRQILMLSEEAAMELDWHYDDQFQMTIVAVPPAYGECIWYNNREKELNLINQTKRYLRRKLW